MLAACARIREIARPTSRAATPIAAAGGELLRPTLMLTVAGNDEDYDVLSDGVVKTRPPTEAASVTNRKFFDCGRRKALPPPALTKL
jgi:hypothetical protein